MRVPQVGGLYPLAGKAAVVSALVYPVRRNVRNTHVGNLGAAELFH